MARAEGNRFIHAFDENCHPSAQLPGDAELLVDRAAYLAALIDAYNSTAHGARYLRSAEAAAQELDKRFRDGARGGYFDTEADADAVGYMRLREKPLLENVLVAESLLQLHHSTGDAAYRSAAESLLSAFVEANRDFGEHAAAYAVAVDHYLHPPVEITVEGPTGETGVHTLVLAASRVNHPHVIVKAVAGESGSAAMAHVCVDTLCFPPVSDPEDLAESVAEALNGPQNPLENIFERFVSF